MKQVLRIILPLLLLTGCGDEPGPDLRFRFWGDQSEMKIISDTIEEFKKQNPGVTIRPERKPADATYADTLLTEFAANRAPDVIFLGDLNCDKLIEQGRFEPLDDFISGDSEIKKEDYYKLMIERFSKRGKLYLLPRDIAPVAVMYYNKKLFDEAGLDYPEDDWTWKEFRQLAVKLTRRDAEGKTEVFGFSDEAAGLEAWIMTSGGTMVDDFRNPTRITMDSARALRGIQLRLDMLRKDKSMPAGADQTAMMGMGAQGLFMSGRLAMLYSGIWKTPAFREIKDFDWDVVPFPAGPDGNREVPIAGSGYGINVDSKNKALAWKLVKFLAGEKGQRRLATTGLAQPAIRRLAESEVFLDGRKPANKKFLLKSASVGYPGPALSDWNEFMASIMRPATDPMWVTGFDGDMKSIVRKAVAEGNEQFFEGKQ